MEQATQQAFESQEDEQRKKLERVLGLDSTFNNFLDSAYKYLDEFDIKNKTHEEKGVMFLQGGGWS
jgi:hypothetical protein